MKTKEFRIGNYVNAVRCDGSKIIDKVEALHENYVSTSQKWGKVEPIPITEEWLVKFDMQLYDGFSSTRFLNVVKHEYDTCKITYNPKEELLRFSNGQQKGVTLIPHVKYVHQLQNLFFALTGEELTIKEEVICDACSEKFYCEKNRGMLNSRCNKCYNKVFKKYIKQPNKK